MTLVCCIACVVASGSSNQAHTAEDSDFLRTIHQGWLIHAFDNDGIYPTPGLIDRQPDPVKGHIPGLGAEDKLVNNTANIHSASIMLMLYSPLHCVGTTELSSHVVIKTDYDYSAYKPRGDVYWDTTFKADLTNVSNVSFANMPVAGERQSLHWRANQDSLWPIVGTRGVANGSHDPAIYGGSVTPHLHGTGGRWFGFEGCNDGHIEWMGSFFTDRWVYVDNSNPEQSPTNQPDNVFRNDNFGDPNDTAATGLDRWLVVDYRHFGTPDHVLAVQPRWD
jgi:hypothetical protein